MFILSSISWDLEFLLENNTSIYENSELKVFKNTEFSCEISNNCPNDLLETDWHISFSIFSDVLPDFTCARAIGNLWNVYLEI